MALKWVLLCSRGAFLLLPDFSLSLVKSVQLGLLETSCLRLLSMALLPQVGTFIKHRGCGVH